MSNIRIKNGTAIEGETLCRSCAFVHMQKGFRESEEMISCKFGYPLRRVLFKVHECTDYREKNTLALEEMWEIAIIVNPSPTLKRAGFRALQDEELEKSELGEMEEVCP
ncbi:MAG: hypothetical protein AB7O65_05155 [Candidatus Korobacteraceae bacterium]